MKILIKITKEVLRRSMFCQPLDINESCAIAVAIRDLFPGATVGDCFINRLAEQIPLPQSARRFTYSFDSKSPIERMQMNPFSFEIDVPSSVVDSIGIGECYRVLSESRTLELVHP